MENPRVGIKVWDEQTSKNRGEKKAKGSSTESCMIMETRQFGGVRGWGKQKKDEERKKGLHGVNTILLVWNVYEHDDKFVR